MDLSIIIVNYRSKVKTAKCLEAIFKSDLANLKYEVIVVENASGENLDDLIGAQSELKVLYSSRNLGMGGGNNLGLKEARGQFILILNPDTEVYPKAIKILYDYLDSHSDVYIVGPKLLNPDKTLQPSCSLFPKIYTPILRRTFLGDYFKSSRDGFMMTDFDHEEIREVDWLMGSCLLVRSDGWEGFDERFFMYFEDIDVCRRAWRFKKKVVYHPQAIVIHDHARGSAKNPWYIAPFTDKLTQEHIKSWIKYFWKWRNK
ncbi:hypothetical protein COX68_03180 [Candidatus Falkowbacteria bacterium CG_4_10_14_0_2_um_filter_41_15]|uniref:Glycosyltransferase 2-like domain-containing protein n=2 Tax=Candidatus Falkowiibacteriota TaxID=1752728 RepID=A0A2G9ZNF4_9BACT|nr:MAG: hypothetical protein COX21_01870 [Candidatus Falkowbacteria bacterium CG23_combo_of_CG06-09_8_20_14_all_41_10]PJA09219.1 MAG: hypothetical protein COX68_03180 [Candidatus Falkowbacteria bacterium CG_4_10_14_0_2_um_filter_41_15]